MNKILFPIVLAFAAIFTACSNEDLTSSSGNRNNQPEGATCTVEPLDYVDFDTRSSLNIGSAGMEFHWYKDEAHPENSDKLSIFYSDADQTAGVYTLTDITNDKETSARFTSDGFKLTADKRYYAISTTENRAPQGCRIPDKRNIELTYAGQVQKGNQNADHLGAYAYLAASGIAYGDDHVDLHFQHLSLTMRVIMDKLPKDVEFTRLEIYDTENSYLQPLRGFDMTSGLAADGTYTPALKPVDINSAQYKAADRFSMTLQDASNAEHGIKPDLKIVGETGRLDLFIELPPADLTGKNLIFMVYGNNGKAYYINRPGRILLAGKAYQMMANAQEASTYTVRIKVNHDWQLGSTLDQTRATGDPGYDETFGYPKNLYYILCVGGFVRAINDNPVSEIENTTSEQWALSADKTVNTFATPLTFNFDNAADKEAVKNVYIVASNNDLTTLLSSITNNDPESKVQNLVYSIQEENLGSTFTAQQKTQAFMKNLYSTPWTGESASFIGNLGADYFKDIILYHVAAKVDLKWGSSTSVMGSTEATNKVSVNNVANENLSLFQPATKNGTTGFVDGDSSNNYTVTSLIEDDREYNGRQVYYLPQFNIYNVTVGNKTPGNITFTPATTNGFTSWLRWLKKF